MAVLTGAATVALVSSPTARAWLGYNAGRVFVEGRPGGVVGLSASCSRTDLNGADAWCCSSEAFGGEVMDGSMSKSCSPYCFPGEAKVHAFGLGAILVNELQSGTPILVQLPTGELSYEPVLGFLHTVRGGQHSFVRMVHAHGVIRASATHLVFVADSDGRRTSKAAAEVRVGDYVYSASNNTVAPSEVLDISYSITDSGMFAPLTASGTIVVDDAVASIYAQPSVRARLPHSAAHAAFFMARVGHNVQDLFSVATPLMRSSDTARDGMHPLAELLLSRLRLDAVLAGKPGAGSGY